MRKIRESLHYLAEKLRAEHPLASEELESDGGSLFIKKYGQLIDLPEDGQTAIEGGAVGAAAHVAYHLGAVRQKVRGGESGGQ